MIRLFVNAPLVEGGTIAPDVDQARYLTQVMRRAVGDPVSVFNGVDGEWRAILSQIGKRGCVLSVTVRTREQSTTPDLELVVALVKRARLETIVEKATELGVRRIRLTITQHTNADHAKVSRLQAIAVEAAEQTGRLDVPTVEEPEKLDRLLSGWGATRRLLFCDEGGDARPVIEALAKITDAGPWAILIGPEGGFSLEERARLRALPFVTPATLGPRILRADTAAISALTLWQAALGDWTS
ncbi:MAG: rRNA ((1498)-N(3))-methyltransferase [Acidimicrobiales bacterium]|nr:rRNA ((1498)-N(3))-methyltransferase [Acidimicrobiales bacterium]